MTLSSVTDCYKYNNSEWDSCAKNAPYYLLTKSNSIAKDGSNTIQLLLDSDAWGGNRGLIYTKLENQEWISTRLLPDIEENKHITGCKLVLDEDNNAHVFYNQGEDSLKLGYLTNEDGEWSSQITFGNDIYPTSFAGVVDQENRLCFTFTDSDGLHFYVKDGEEFEEMILDDSATGRTSLAIDDEGMFHITYFKPSDDLYYMTYLPGDDPSEPVFIDDQNGYEPIMAPLDLDPEGNAHLCYAKVINDIRYDERIDLLYATNKSGSWMIETVWEGGVSIW